MESDKGEQTDDTVADTAQPPMNRAERRALEHKKKSGGTGNSGGFGNQQARPAGGKVSGGTVKSNLPRTGHK